MLYGFKFGHNIIKKMAISIELKEMNLQATRQYKSGSSNSVVGMRGLK